VHTRCRGAGSRALAEPLHDIVITNIVWRMAYKERVGGGWGRGSKKGSGGGEYIAQKLHNSIAVVWVMRMGGGNKWMIDSCTHETSERLFCIGQALAQSSAPNRRDERATGGEPPRYRRSAGVSLM